MPNVSCPTGGRLGSICVPASTGPECPLPPPPTPLPKSTKTGPRILNTQPYQSPSGHMVSNSALNPHSSAKKIDSPVGSVAFIAPLFTYEYLLIDCGFPKSMLP